MGKRCEVCGGLEAVAQRAIQVIHGSTAHLCEECWGEYQAMYGTPKSQDAPVARSEGRRAGRVRKGIVREG